jgi:mannose-6-phosphate isomerase-like protein (cupin superfamily)
MIHVVKLADLPTSGGATPFEGGPYGAGVSFFLVDSAPGDGPDVHSHPYPEVFVVRHGQARFFVDGEGLDAEGGDIVVAPANVPHGFMNAGPGRLEMINLHPSGAMITRWLTD